jgi:hypothetical protein
MTNQNCPTEKTEHLSVARYLNYLGLLYNHSPNEGKREVQYAAQLKAMGMRKGFPDFFIYEPRGPYHGLAIELKRLKGGKLSDSQKQVLEQLAQRGYMAKVCKGFDEARKVINYYMALDKE